MNGAGSRGEREGGLNEGEGLGYGGDALVMIAEHLRRSRSKLEALAGKVTAPPLLLMP